MLPIMFAAFALTGTKAVIALAALAGLGGYLVTKGDSRVEARRRDAVKLSRIASENGLPLTSGMLDAYAVGDYSGVMGGVQNLHDTLTDEKQRKAAVNLFLETQLDRHIADPALRDSLFALIEKKSGAKITLPKLVPAA